MSNRVPFDLYLVTDRNRTGGRSLLAVMEEALEAGVRAVQLRERDLTTHELLSLAERMRTMTDLSGASLLINDRIDVCLAVSADGVHLRADHLPISVVRRLLGPKRLIGVSCHSVQEVITADKEGADFVVLGPIYETPSKRSYGQSLGLNVLKSAAACSTIPIFAIGGIQVHRIQEVLKSGVSGIAMISSILGADDVRGSVRHVNDILRLRRNTQDLTAIDRIGSR